MVLPGGGKRSGNYGDLGVNRGEAKRVRGKVRDSLSHAAGTLTGRTGELVQATTLLFETGEKDHEDEREPDNQYEFVPETKSSLHDDRHQAEEDNFQVVMRESVQGGGNIIRVVHGFLGDGVDLSIGVDEGWDIDNSFHKNIRLLIRNSVANKNFIVSARAAWDLLLDNLWIFTFFRKNATSTYHKVLVNWSGASLPQETHEGDIGSCSDEFKRHVCKLARSLCTREDSDGEWLQRETVWGVT